MSIIKGPIEFTGSLGNMRSYYDPSIGKQILSRKGGPTRVQFLNDPNYACQRQVSSELIGRSIWASQIKQGLSDLRHLMHSRCFNLIQAEGKKIQEQDNTSPNGQLAVIVKNNPGVLTGIDFNKISPFNKVIGDIYEVILHPDKQTITFFIPGFNSSKDVKWVNRFFAVKFSLVIAQISDVVWNPVIEGYVKVVPNLHVSTRCTYGNWIVRNNESGDVSLTAAFDTPALTMPGTTAIAALGVEFSAPANNSQPAVLYQNGSLAIVKYWTA